MRTLHNPLPLLALVLLALVLLIGAVGPLAADEFDPAKLDSFTAIGSDAKAKMIELLNLYEGTMTNNLRDLVENASYKSDPDWWADVVRTMQDNRVACRGEAFNLYRSWAEGKGADRSKIEDLPSDWVRLEKDYAHFFDAAELQGYMAYASLTQLLADAVTMNGFVWTDGLRIDDAVLIAKEANDAMVGAKSIMDQLRLGMHDSKQARANLAKFRDKLKFYASAWRNREAVLDDMTKRVKAMTTGDQEASERIEMVKDWFAGFTRAVESEEPYLRGAREAAYYEGLLERHCKRFEEMQEDWLKRVEPITQGTLFKDLSQLKCTYAEVHGKMQACLAEIDKVL